MWRKIPASALTDVGWLATAERLWNRSGALFLEQNIPFAASIARYANQTHVVFEYNDNGKFIGYANVEVGLESYNWCVGQIKLFRHMVARIRFVGDMVVSWHDFTTERQAEIVWELLRTLRESFPHIPLFLETVPTGTALHDLVLSGRVLRMWLVPRSPFPVSHYAADLPSSFSAYLAQRGQNTRRTWKRRSRLLSAHCNGRVSLKMYRKIDEVDEFLNISMKIAETTYQFRMGIGLHDGEKIKRSLNEYAKHGWFRGYVLFCQDEAVAFSMGYQVGATFRGVHTGYLPGWGRWSVGSVLMFETMKQLISDDDGPQRVDFGLGHWGYKERMATRYREEQSYYLIDKTLKNFPILITMHLTIFVWKLVKIVSHKMHADGFLKNLLRRMASSKTVTRQKQASSGGGRSKRRGSGRTSDTGNDAPGGLWHGQAQR